MSQLVSQLYSVHVTVDDTSSSSSRVVPGDGINKILNINDYLDKYRRRREYKNVRFRLSDSDSGGHFFNEFT